MLILRSVFKSKVLLLSKMVLFGFYSDLYTIQPYCSYHSLLWSLKWRLHSVRKVLQSHESLEKRLGMDRWMGAAAGGIARKEAPRRRTQLTSGSVAMGWIYRLCICSTRRLSWVLASHLSVKSFIVHYWPVHPIRNCTWFENADKLWQFKNTVFQL